MGTSPDETGPGPGAGSPQPLGQTLRIGVTGTQRLTPAQLYFIRPRVEALLRTIIAAVPRVQLLSPLAEGADRLVAECALTQGCELACPLPFAQAVYEDDFGPASRDDFRRLLARAEGRVLALDGARDDPKTGLYPEARSYEAVGRLLVRNTDLIIAIWSGSPGEGQGGTADTVRYAANFGPPVIWVHATDGIAEPRWIEDSHDLLHGAAARPYMEPLVRYLHRLLTKPGAHESAHAGILHALGDRLGAAIAGEKERPAPLDACLNEKPNPTRGPWRAHDWLMQTLGGRTPGRERAAEPADPAARRWFGHYKPADGRARESAQRYRSCYVWVFFLATIALSSAAVSLGYGEHLQGTFDATAVELLAVALIAGLVMADGRFGWHRRSIDYRLLAELCRKQQALAPLGWVVPRATAWAEADDNPAPWVAWLFSAWLREAPLPTGTIDRTWVGQVRDSALTGLLQPQIDYHRDRLAQNTRAAKRLERLGEAAFGIVIVVVAWKLSLMWGHIGPPKEALVNKLHILGLLGAILPAMSAFFVGIRAYAELELLAEQSALMLKALTRAERQIITLDPAEPLASQALGVALAGVALLMLEDLEGWARLFRGKVLDA